MKQISFTAATAIGLGAIIGAGIFVLSGTAIALAGSYALLAFVLVGIIAILVALELGELGTIMPNAKGAAYSYTYNAFGSEIGFITGLLMWSSYAIGMSVIALGFGSYLASILSLQQPYFPIVFAILVIIATAFVNIKGIRRTAKTDLVLVLIKSMILIAFVIFAMFIVFKSGSFSVQNFVNTKPQSTLAAIFDASVAIFFAYGGFQTISSITSRVEGGSRKAASAIVFSVVISIVLYLFVVLSLIVLAPASSYTISGDPLSYALQTAHAPNSLFLIVDFGALIATTSAIIAYLLSASQMFYQMGKDKLLPKFTRKYDKKGDVAVTGVYVSAAVAILMLLFESNIYVIAAISNFGLLFSYIMSSVAIMHFRKEGRRGSYRIPFYPYLPIIAIIALFALMLGMPQQALIVGMILILVLIVIYYFFREVEHKKVIRVRLFD